VLIAASDTATLTTWSHGLSRPGHALSATADVVKNAYWALFKGAIFDPHAVARAWRGGSIRTALNPISETLVNATPLLLGGLAVTISFRAGVFNIGGQGQIIFGAIAASFVAFALPLPPVAHQIVALAAAAAGGALFAGIAGVMKVRAGAHEVITTIMFNYVALNLLAYLLGTSAFQRSGETGLISPTTPASARLPHLLGGNLRVEAGLLVAVAAAIAIGWMTQRTRLGFELRAVGLNESAARTAGMSVPRTVMRVFLISGGLAGLAGADQILGTQYALSPTIDAGLGFTAITVALLGGLTARGTVLASVLFGALQAGGIQMQAATNTPVEIVSVIQSLIVVFIAAPAFIAGVFGVRRLGSARHRSHVAAT
jgi:general nucleoside transport system permease protein